MMPGGQDLVLFSECLMVAQVKYFEAVDAMVSQLVARLAAFEAAGGCSCSVLVTGDHSTPVVFGDHSHEPVPLAVAHVRWELSLVKQPVLRQSLPNARMC